MRMLFVWAKQKICGHKQKLDYGAMEKIVVWKYPPEKMGLEWVERVPNPPIEDVTKSYLGISTEGYLNQLNFYYPKVGGIQALSKSLETKIGDSAVTNFEVAKISEINGKWIISDGNQEILCDKIISTIPIQCLVKATDAPKKIKEAANDLKYNSLITVMMGLRKKFNKNLSWLYIPDHKILTHRASFPSNFSQRVAPAGMSSVMAEITCKKEDTVWRKKDEDIAKRVINDLHHLKVINKQDVCFALTRRTRYAYVINDLNYNKNIKKIRNYFTKMGIGLVGRFSEFKYLNMDACVKRAIDYLKQTT